MYFNREWVQYLALKLHEHFLIYDALKLSRFLSKGMWYQQYAKNSVHNWHIHGDLFIILGVTVRH